MQVASTPLEIVGFTLGEGPRPIRHLFLEVEPGLNALYGLNGAGKTRVLAAVRAAASGARVSAESASMHLRVSDVESSTHSGFMWQVVQAAQLTWFTEDSEAPHPARSGFGQYRWSDLVWEAAKQHGMDPEGELVPLITEQGLLSCRPSGSAAVPAWDVFVACRFRAGSEDLVSAALLLSADADRADRRLKGLAPQWEALSEEERLQALEELANASEAASLSSPELRLSLRLRNLRRDAPGPWVHNEIVPLWQVCTVSVPPAQIFDDAVEISALADETLTMLMSDPAGVPRRVLSVADASEAEPDPDFADASRNLAEAATLYARAVVPNAPTLSFVLGHPEDWVRGSLPHWTGWDEATGRAVPLADLGRAHTRWAALGIALAMRSCAPTAEPSAPLLFLCDEPEQGLHRRAEADMGAGFARLAHELRACVIAASHSPAVLTEPLVNLIEIKRSPTDGAVVAAPLQVSLGSHVNADDNSSLGLTRSDLLQLVRVAVVVEGLHDEIILQALIGRELDAAGAWLLPMRGAKELRHLADAQLLFDFTSAAVLVVVDNVTGVDAIPVWNSARAEAQSGNRSAAKTALARLLRQPGWEAQWLHELGARAVDTGQLHRITIFPLSAPDVVCYLPVESLVAEKDWQTVLAKWRQQPREGRLDLKAWMASKYGRPIGRRLITDAVEQMTDVPEEVERLARVITELGGFGGMPAGS